MAVGKHADASQPLPGFLSDESRRGLCARGCRQHIDRVWSSGEAVGDQDHGVLVSHFSFQDEGAAQARAELDHVQHCDWRLPCAMQCSTSCLVVYWLVTALADKGGRLKGLRNMGQQITLCLHIRYLRI